ncbi:MAG: hypothetical protein AAB390_04520 [Patescibacteria group bacterium]
MKYARSFISIVFIATALAFVSTANVNAETEGAAAADSGAVTVESASATVVAPAGIVSAEAQKDDAVTAADLGAVEAGVLPDSPWYSFKRLGRGIRRAFIFDSAKKIQQEIKDGNQELVDLSRLMAKKGNEASDAVLRGFERVEKRFDSIAERAAGMAGKDELARRAVLEKMLDSEMKRQKVFEGMENNQAQDEQVLERARQVRERGLERVGGMMQKVEVDPAMFDRVMQNQAGSQFKDLRNLEVLKRLEEKLPAEAREAIQQAEENAFKRLQAQVTNFQDDGSKERFNEYLKDFGGDRVIRFELLNTLEEKVTGAELPPAIRENIKEARDLSAVEFQARFEEMSERAKNPARMEYLKKMKEKIVVEPQEAGGGSAPIGFDPGPVGFDPGPVGKESAGQGNPAGADGAQKKLEQRGLIPIPSGKPVSDLERTGLIPIPSGKPVNDLERRGLIPIPSGKPTSDLERTGLIPLPSGKPTDGLEQRGLIPIPGGDTGPGTDQAPKPPSPISDAVNPREGGSDLEQRGLIPIPSGDTGPGGNSGPSPAPTPAPRIVR